MAELTEAQLNGISSINDAAAHINLDGNEGDNTTPLGSFLLLLGAQTATSINAIGVIPAQDYNATLQNWRISVAPATPGDAATNRAPTTIERGKALYVGRIARVKLGIEPRTPSAVAAPGPAAPSATSSAATRRVKLNQILSQLDETEVDVIDAAEQIRMMARYETLFGKGQRPPPNQEPSVEQLSGLKSLVDGNQCPYADFAIFQPHAARIMKKIKFSGLVLTKAGNLSQAEIYGPPNIENWRACYDVYANALVMLDVADLGPLQLYKSKIDLLFLRYGEQKIWPLLYQADTRARLENMPRWKLTLQREHDEAVAAGKTTPYEPNRPWNHTLYKVANDEKFWQHKFVEPAMLVINDGSGRGSQAVTGDDARTAAKDGNNVAADSVHPDKSSAASFKTTTRNSNRTGRVHNFADGAYKSNRTGYPLCSAFNEGSCTSTVQGSWCGTNRDHAHQCSRCLGSHPVTRCPHTEAPVVGWVKDKPGKGKGKGGRKGRGGGRKSAPY